MRNAEASVEEYIQVPPREARGIRVSAGTKVRCIDNDGGQCGDLFAFVDGDITEYQSSEHTRVHVSRLFPRVGEEFVTNRRRTILTFLEDSTPGRHDMLIAACDPTRYQSLGVQGEHASCQENLETVMRDFGFEEIEIPSPINLFTNLPVDSEGAFKWDPAVTQAGDSVTIRAELDCYLVLSACPQDVTAINSREPSSLAIQILG